MIKFLFKNKKALSEAEQADIDTFPKPTPRPAPDPKTPAAPKPLPKKEQAKLSPMMRTLKRAGISNPLVLKTMDSIDRQDFLPDPLKPLADRHYAVPIDFDQTLSKPVDVAIMTQALLPEKGRPKDEKILDNRSRARVLEIGTGSGYHAYVLSRLFRRVFTIERHPELCRRAKKRLVELGALSVTVRCGDGHEGWPEQAPFDRILCTAFSLREVPAKLMEQLAVHGILVAPIVDKNGNQNLYAYQRNPDETFSRKVLAPVSFVPMLSGVAEVKRRGR